MNKSQAVCRYFASGGTCFYGNDCQFIHGNPDQHQKQNDSGPLLGEEVFAGYELPAESKLSSYIPLNMLSPCVMSYPSISQGTQSGGTQSSSQVPRQFTGSIYSAYREPVVNVLVPPSQATRVPKDPMANSMSNLSIQDVNAQEFVPSSNPGSSSSLNNVPNPTMPHTMSSPSFVKSSHMLRDRESPENSPVIARRSFMRNPSPLTVNGGDYTGMYQESLGGTTYFYQPHEENGAPSTEMLPPGPGAHTETEIIPPTFHAYPGPPSHVEHMKPKANAPSFFMPDDLRLELLNRATILNSRCNADLFPDLPQQIDNYTNICPLENQINKSSCYGLMTTVYKATNVKSGLVYCLRRVHNFRLSSNKAIIEVIDHWKKIQHSNLVQLRELFTTKAFGDNSVVFVYDFFPGAQTLKQTYFAAHPSMQGGGGGGPVGYNGAINGGKNRGAARMQQDASLRQGHGLLPESLIWTYIVQLSSALRTIHAANLAMRCIDPSKVLLSSAGKSRLRLNCAAIVDLITIDAQQQQQRTLIPHHQKEDLTSLGRLILCLACNNPTAYQYLENSLDCVTKHYSTDLRNLLLLLLGHPLRVTTINDIMPMIGARFYTQLDSAQMRSDVLEAELAKEVENGRLFRLLMKLGAINERPELNMDTTWSETGDRYMLKLFRDYLFHQCTKEGLPWLDMAHVVQCLNKLDAGVDEKICLVSRDEQNVLVVSYSELKRCIEAAFSEVYHKPHST